MLNFDSGVDRFVCLVNKTREYIWLGGGLGGQHFKICDIGITICRENKKNYLWVALVLFFWG